ILAMLATELPAGARPLSSMAFRLGKGDRWEPWIPSASASAGAAAFRENAEREIAGAYAAQRAAVAATDPTGGEARGAFHAQIMVAASRTDGTVRTIATWTPGVATVLPKVDCVALNMRFPRQRDRDIELSDAVGGSTEPVMVEWDRFMEIC